MSEWHTVLVSRFFVCDDDEGVHEADNPLSFEQTDALLTKLRDENPTVNYSLVAELDG
jgi:hypothetical protein